MSAPRKETIQWLHLNERDFGLPRDDGTQRNIARAMEAFSDQAVIKARNEGIGDVVRLVKRWYLDLKGDGQDDNARDLLTWMALLWPSVKELRRKER